MLNFELKKVFSKSRNKIVILLMVVIYDNYQHFDY